MAAEVANFASGARLVLIDGTINVAYGNDGYGGQYYVPIKEISRILKGGVGKLDSVIVENNSLTIERVKDFVNGEMVDVVNMSESVKNTRKFRHVFDTFETEAIMALVARAS